MRETFEDYESFDSIETARFVLLDILEAQHVPYTIYKDNYRQDVILGKGINFSEIWVRLRPEDFAKVNALLLEDAERRNEVIAPDYYLHEFSDTELLEILKKPDEWSTDDYIIARNLLREHGLDIATETMDLWKKERKEILKREKRNALEIPAGKITADVFLNRGLHTGNASIVDKETGKREYVGCYS